MIQLKSVQIKKTGSRASDAYPMNLPLIQSLDIIEFDSPVTILVGENGTGKSTLLEAMAAAIGLPSIGYKDTRYDKTLDPVRRLSNHLSLAWKVKSHRGFFLRSEDFFNFTRRLSETRAEMLAELQRIDNEYKDRSSYARSLARMPYAGSLAEMESRYGRDLDAYSHGESFLKVFESRFVPDGLYMLDEPEAPLSPTRQLALIALMKDMVSRGCQFILSTHSPILMAFPGASILSLDELPPRKVAYDELEHVILTRDFLNNPEQFLRHL